MDPEQSEGEEKHSGGLEQGQSPKHSDFTTQTFFWGVNGVEWWIMHSTIPRERERDPDAPNLDRTRDLGPAAILTQKIIHT